ncbi:MAG: TGS domain-containing protein [Clostridia bacterium]
MPANLSADYMEAEQRWRRASDPGERLAALQDMLSTIPKHKGTEKMQGDIKRRIAKLRDQMESKKGSGGRKKPAWVVDRQGAGQILIAGPPNSGKSALVASLTNAEPEIADYPFSTTLPHPAMMETAAGVQIQLVDLPPLHVEMSPPWLAELFRTTDAVVLMLDLSDDDLLTKTEAAFDYLDDRNIVPEYARVSEGTDELAGSDDPAEGYLHPTLVVGSKADDEGAGVRLELLREMWQDAGYPRLPFLPISIYDTGSLEKLRNTLWVVLDKIRVYTRPPGRDPELSTPFVLARGSTVVDLAYAIHKDVGAAFRYARAWGKDTFDAQKVGRDYVLTDGDILEIHTDAG